MGEDDPSPTYVRSPLASANTAQISKSGHSALVDFQIRGEKEKAADKVAPVLAAVAAAQRAHPGFTIGEFGDASAEKGVTDSYDKDLGKAGTLSLPITLIVLLLTFGSLVAAGIPLSEWRASQRQRSQWGRAPPG